MAMIEREETAQFARVSRTFLKNMHGVSPSTIVIERQLKLYQALQDTLPSSSVLFCYFHILRTLKTQYAFLEKDRPEEYKLITDLPVIESPEAFDEQLSRVESFKYSNEYHKLII